MLAPRYALFPLHTIFTQGPFRVPEKAGHFQLLINNIEKDFPFDEFAIEILCDVLKKRIRFQSKA